MSRFRQIVDMLRLLPQGGPGVCNMAITSVCNAGCDFCNYAVRKKQVKDRISVDFDAYCHAVDILHARGVRFITLVGGEPTLHPRIFDIVAYAARRGVQPSIVTNGSRLSSAYVHKLKHTGLKTLFISMDAASDAEHERNRGLPGVCGRIREAAAECERIGIHAVASVTINRLIRNIPELMDYLYGLGLKTVNFAYPKRMLHSPALSFSSDSHLIDYAPGELAQIIETIRSLKDRYAILNSEEALSEALRFIRGDPQLFPCQAGYKYFYVDYHLDLYRCDFWPEKMCPVHDFKALPFVRDSCTRCLSGCYRDASVLMHAGVSLADAAGRLRAGEWARAAQEAFKRTNYLSAKTLVRNWKTLRKLARIQD